MKYLVLFLFMFVGSAALASPPPPPSMPITPNMVDQNQGQDQNQQVINQYDTNIYTPCYECENITNQTADSKEYNAALAGIAAMASIPWTTHYGNKYHTSVGVGGGYYAGENALALGVNHQFEQLSLTLNVSKSVRTSTAVGAGAAWSF